MDYSKVTTENLDEYMGITELPIEVHEGGTVTQADDDVRSPELYVEVDAEGQMVSGEDALHDMAAEQGWELLSGYTGQSGYNGAVMDRAEYIGGRMAEDILSTPGVYTAVVVETANADPGVGDEVMRDEPAGWAVARQMI